LGEIFLFLFCLCWLKIHRDLKTFWVYLRALFENYFKLSILLEEPLWENERFQKCYFPSFIQTYASLLAEKWITKVFIKIVLQTCDWVWISIINFIKYYSPIFKKIQLETLILFLLCKQSYLAQLTIFIKNLVLFLKTCFSLA
jgi:hypothetical protein